ncbi:hypothetical protein JW926_17840 [Candidatus Sumerlaeota bacterium]|nr:hypothetical protein [Candidatus Sumerlaeota bacterium]
MKRTFVILIIFLIAGVLPAASLKVSPGGFIVHDVIPGKTYNLQETTGVKLSIFNDDDTTHTYSLTVRKPSVAGKWEKGYDEIPEPGWCWFEPKEATIGPRKVGYGNLYFRVPEKERYFNQRWAAALGVMGKQESGIGFGLGIYVRIQMETESRADSKGIPEGLTALKPNLLHFEKFLPGTSQTGKLTVYNNDIKKHIYKISFLSEEKERPASAYRTHSFDPLPDSSWIALENKTFEIAAGGSFILNVKIRIPHEQGYENKKWEEILFLEPETGLSGFVRLRISTGEKDVQANPGK